MTTASSPGSSLRCDGASVAPPERQADCLVELGCDLGQRHGATYWSAVAGGGGRTQAAESASVTRIPVPASSIEACMLATKSVAIIAPKTATPRPPPNWRAALKLPDARPAWLRHRLQHRDRQRRDRKSSSHPDRDYSARITATGVSASTKLNATKPAAMITWPEQRRLQAAQRDGAWRRC